LHATAGAGHAREWGQRKQDSMDNNPNAVFLHKSRYRFAPTILIWYIPPAIAIDGSHDLDSLKT
jgi:hypothetical protein